MLNSSKRCPPPQSPTPQPQSRYQKFKATVCSPAAALGGALAGLTSAVAPAATAGAGSAAGGSMLTLGGVAEGLGTSAFVTAGGSGYEGAFSLHVANRSSQIYQTPQFHSRRGITITGGVSLCRPRKEYGRCLIPGFPFLSGHRQSLWMGNTENKKARFEFPRTGRAK
jgi:hypothetical protein